MNITKPMFHIVVCICLTAIACIAMCLKENTIAGTALGAIGGYVLKNGVPKKDE